MLLHEYSIVGHSRAVIGRHLGTLAAAIASACSVVSVAAWNLVESLGFSSPAPKIGLLTISAGAVFYVVHALFNHWVWKFGICRRVFKIPDLNGEWECKGQTLHEGTPTYEWKGLVTIIQTWEKIKVRLQTDSSKSYSIAAAIINDPGRGFLLMYSYRNEPKIGVPELHSHVGYCEFSFDESLSAAEGEYFNNKGRVTYGRMTLKRKKKK